MRISIFGSGYAGHAQAAVFSEAGHDAACTDVVPSRIEQIKGGDLLFLEPGLADLVKAGVAQGKLRFTSDTEAAVEHGDYLFICVGTPSAADGSADLQYVMAVARGVAQHMTS